MSPSSPFPLPDVYVWIMHLGNQISVKNQAESQHVCIHNIGWTVKTPAHANMGSDQISPCPSTTFQISICFQNDLS